MIDPRIEVVRAAGEHACTEDELFVARYDALRAYDALDDTFQVAVANDFAAITRRLNFLEKMIEATHPQCPAGCDGGERPCAYPEDCRRKLAPPMVQPLTVLDEVDRELQRAQRLFPAFHSAHEGWAVIKEELDELWEVVREKQSAPGRNDRMRKEAIQVAAMALRFLVEMNGFQN